MRPSATNRVLTLVRCIPRVDRIAATRRDSRFATYDPGRDIFTNDLCIEESATASELKQLEGKRALRETGADLSKLIDTGDLLPKRWSFDFSHVQRSLFRKPVEEHPDLEALSMKRLRSICRSYGLKSTGLKRVLIQQIVEYEKTHEEGSCWRSGSPPVLEELLAM